MAHWFSVSEFHLQEHRTVKEEGGENPRSKNLNKENNRNISKEDEDENTTKKGKGNILEDERLRTT